MCKEHSHRANEFKKNICSSLDEMNAVILNDIFVANRRIARTISKNRNGKHIVHMRALEVIALMLGSATVDAASRSIRGCDQVLQYLCNKMFEFSDKQHPNDRLQWLCSQVVHTARFVTAYISDGDFDSAPDSDTFLSSFLEMCHPDVNDALMEQFGHVCPELMCFAPVLLKPIVISETSKMNGFEPSAESAASFEGVM